MSQASVQLRNWLASFFPAPAQTQPREWLRAALGAVLGLWFSVWACALLFGPAVPLALIGPLGASAILLFAVSSGALAQPWSIMGSYLVASLVALTMSHFFDHTLLAGGLAVGASLLLMCPLRCLHPPGAALALCMVHGGPALHELGFMAVLPALTSAVALLLCALLYNNLTRVRYPKAHAIPVDLHHTRDPAPEARVGITSDDLEQALAEFGEFVDITREDLEQLIRSTEQHALRRSMGNIRAADIMSRDVRCATPQTSVKQALRLLSDHHLKALPVVDEQQHLLGMVDLVDLLGYARPSKGRRVLRRLGWRQRVRVRDVMGASVVSVNGSAHVIELTPLLSGRGLHCLPVVEQGRLLGVITQTDLIAALHRDLVMHLG